MIEYRRLQERQFLICCVETIISQLNNQKHSIDVNKSKKRRRTADRAKK